MSAAARWTSPSDYYAGLKSRAREVIGRYRKLTPASARLAEEAARVQPGGSTRDAVFRAPYPCFVVKGEGSLLTDVDGRAVLDFALNATSLPLGHCHPAVMAAARAQLDYGTAFMAPTPLDVDFARLLCERLPAAERLRFTNSGTEAVMLALQFARGFTGRPLVAKFEGSYHGTYDDVSWSVGGGGDPGPPERPEPVPAAIGLPPGSGRALVLPFNDIVSTERLVAENADRLAAILVEPVPHRMGLVLPAPAFIEGLRALCDLYGILLVFDEVISFRLGYQGMQGVLGVGPDLTTLGKIIGGGFPVGAVAGRREVMAVSEPQRPSRVPHYGTFSANPVTMAAGKATLEALTPEVFAELNAAGDRLRAELARICAGLPLQITGVGSLFKINATPLPIRNHRDSLRVDNQWQEIASLALLNEGFLLTTKLHGCLATSTTREHIDSLLAAVERLVHER
jgi:glutamate-1-semialdehyde 2,1-aminomutase